MFFVLIIKTKNIEIGSAVPCTSFLHLIPPQTVNWLAWIFDRHPCTMCIVQLPSWSKKPWCRYLCVWLWIRDSLKRCTPWPIGIYFHFCYIPQVSKFWSPVILFQNSLSFENCCSVNVALFSKQIASLWGRQRRKRTFWGLLVARTQSESNQTLLTHSRTLLGLRVPRCTLRAKGRRMFYSGPYNFIVQPSSFHMVFFISGFSSRGPFENSSREMKMSGRSTKATLESFVVCHISVSRFTL